jgi:hypothetical protein
MVWLEYFACLELSFANLRGWAKKKAKAKNQSLFHVSFSPFALLFHKTRSIGPWPLSGPFQLYHEKHS